MFSLKEKDIPSDNPFKLFRTFLKTHNDGVLVQMASVDSQNRPSNRTLLFHGFDESNGFYFNTRSDSRKKKDFLNNPYTALVFMLLPNYVQIRVEGKVNFGKESDNEIAWSETHPIIQSTVNSFKADTQIHDRNNYKQAIINKYRDPGLSNYNESGKGHWERLFVVPFRFEFVNVQSDVPDKVIYLKNEEKWELKRMPGP